VIRAATAGAGIAIAAYGCWRLLELGTHNLVATGTWLVGGVVLHDAVLAPLTIAAAWVAARFLSRRRRAAWVVASVLLAPVTILSIPVLGRFGARPSEPSLLNRPYWLGWCAMVALVGVAILVGTHVRRAGSRTSAMEGTEGGAHGPRDGGR
jgi:hypothetical protein